MFGGGGVAFRDEILYKLLQCGLINSSFLELLAGAITN